MAQAATNPKIEELRFRLKSDLKSRIFFPLAEELRKVGELAEAEQVLRTGLTNHPTYLSAWVSLGRVLHDLHEDQDAVESLNKALQLDPGNVVAARLLAQSYLALGEKVEAIKKFKLVYALLPGDEELEGIIERLDREINAPAVIPEPETIHEESPFAESPTQQSAPAAEAAVPESGSAAFEPPSFEQAPFDAPGPAAQAGGSIWDDTDEAKVFHDSTASLRRERTTEADTGDAEPMSAAHAESPFEEPAVSEGYGTDAFAIEQPPGMHAATAPLGAELPEPLPLEPLPPEFQAAAPPSAETAAEEADVFEPADSGLAPGIVTEPFSVISTMPPMEAEDFARTLTMADLYAGQGLVNEARDIYEDILARDPGNAAVRAKLDALSTMEPVESEAPAPEGPWEAEPVQMESGPAAEIEQAQELPAPGQSAERPAAPAAHMKVEKLSGWLAKVKRGEGSV